MSSRTIVPTPEAKAGHYTRLRACISEDDDGFLLQVTLYDAKWEDAAWGEEVADTFEQASEWVGALAAEFSIPADCIEIELHMDNPKDGTRH
jgi:hypothetical protein